MAVAHGEDDDVARVEMRAGSSLVDQGGPSTEPDNTAWKSITCSAPGITLPAIAAECGRLADPGRLSMPFEEDGAGQTHGAEHVGENIH